MPADADAPVTADKFVKRCRNCGTEKPWRRRHSAKRDARNARLDALLTQLLHEPPAVVEGGLVLCRSDAGDGGWSLHPPGTTDADIASGAAIVLASGPAEMVDGRWTRPDLADYSAADPSRW
jgi:hypothetical protein